MAAIFEGKEFWSGCVSLIDGKIEEVHTYEEAQRCDIPHSLNFSAQALDRMKTEESAFFFVENGEIHSGCRSDIPNWVIGKIAKQIFIERDL